MLLYDNSTHSLLAIGFGFPKFSLKSKGTVGGGNSNNNKENQKIVLLSNRPLGEGAGSSLSSTTSSPIAGITLISKKPLDASCSDLDGKWFDSASRFGTGIFHYPILPC